MRDYSLREIVRELAKELGMIGEDNLEKEQGYEAFERSCYNYVYELIEQGIVSKNKIKRGNRYRIPEESREQLTKYLRYRNMAYEKIDTNSLENQVEGLLGELNLLIELIPISEEYQQKLDLLRGTASELTNMVEQAMTPANLFGVSS